MSVYNDKHRLYREYVSELEALHGEKIFRSDDEVRAAADHYIGAEHARWMNIFDSGKRMVGFLIICRPPECHEHADYYIAQAYVEPDSRAQGLMTARLNEYLEGHRGTYVLYVLTGNEIAAGFWDHFFDKAGYRHTDLREYPVKGAVQLAYKPKKCKRP